MEKEQLQMFEFPRGKEQKSYRAIRHDIVREKQSLNSNEVHHPDEKINQARSVLNELKGTNLNILELFSGHGNLTNIYAEYGEVKAYEYKNKVFQSLKKNTGVHSNIEYNRADSYSEFHNLIGLKEKFNVIDLDPYGFPNRFFPDIFLLIEDGVMFITMPKPYVNILNGITQTHLISYYGEHNPSKEVIMERIILWGLCHWRKVQLIDSIDCKSVWRFAFQIEKVKATEYTGVKNR